MVDKVILVDTGLGESIPMRAMSNGDGTYSLATAPSSGAVDPVTFASGALDSTGRKVVPLAGATIPTTATLVSSSGVRRIRFSSAADVAAHYFVPEYDASTTTMINAGIVAPVTFVEFTGAVGDPWEVL